MDSGHEYCVQNSCNRSIVGKTIYSISAVIATGIIYGLLAWVEWVRFVPAFILSVIITSLLFLAAYKFFDIFGWKIKILHRVIKFPDISGEWKCHAISDYNDGFEWEADISILQTWDKLRIKLKTKQSSSESVSAAIIYDEIEGYRILYNYKNDPKLLDGELRTHIGFVELALNDNFKEAKGSYYNVSGRKTTGKMQWIKVQ